MLTPMRQIKKARKPKKLKAVSPHFPLGFENYNPRLLALEWHLSWLKTMNECEIYYNGERIYIEKSTG